MLIVYAQARLRAPWCRSLKDKRAVIRPLISRLKARFNIATAETGRQDSHSLMELGLVFPAFDAAQADSILEQLYAFILENTQAELLDWQAEYR